MWCMWAVPKNNGVMNTAVKGEKLCRISGIIQARKTNSSLIGAITWLRIQSTFLNEPIQKSVSTDSKTNLISFFLTRI